MASFVGKGNLNRSPAEGKGASTGARGSFDDGDIRSRKGKGMGKGKGKEVEIFESTEFQIPKRCQAADTVINDLNNFLKTTYTNLAVNRNNLFRLLKVKAHKKDINTARKAIAGLEDIARNVQAQVTKAGGTPFMTPRQFKREVTLEAPNVAHKDGKNKKKK